MRSIQRYIVTLIVLSFVCLASIGVLGQSDTGLTGTFILNNVLDDQEVLVMPVGGTEAQNITNSAEADIANSISPDGQKILFSSNRDGDFEIYTMNLTGENLVQLTENSASDNLPAFSPDGTLIAFNSDRGGSTRDIYIMGADGSGVTQITTTEMAELAPAWSPNGQQIAFLQLINSTQDETQRFSTLTFNIGVVSPDGSDFQILVEELVFRQGNPVNRYFAWSPDSSTILYRSAEDDQDTELFSVDVASGAITQLTDNDVEESGFTWTDDGQIVFSSFGGFRTYDLGEDTLSHLYRMDIQSGDVSEIIGVENVLNPIQNLVFVPGTQQVIFERWTPGSDGNRIDLWSVDLETGDTINLTNTPTVSERQFFYVPSSSEAP